MQLPHVAQLSYPSRNGAAHVSIMNLNECHVAHVLEIRDRAGERGVIEHDQRAQVGHDAKLRWQGTAETRVGADVNARPVAH